MSSTPSWERLLDAPCADAIMHQINHSPDSVVFDPYGSLRFEEMPSNAADIGSNRSDEITGHVHDYVPLPERFGGSAPVAPTKPDEALLRLPSELSHLGSRRRGPRPSSTGGAVSSVATTPAPTATAARTTTVARTAKAAPSGVAGGRGGAPVTQLEPTRRRGSRRATTPRERTLASWTLAGAISKPCGDISVAGMTELPPGTDHAALVASVMAAVRGFTGYRGIPHLAVNRTEEQNRELLRQRAAKVASRTSQSGQPRATTDARQPPESESATERGARAHDADEQSGESGSGSGCREQASSYLAPTSSYL